MQLSHTAKALTTRFVLPILLITVSNSVARAIGFDRDDFLISSFELGTIGVYDSDLSYKGLLDSNFPAVSPLAFDLTGNLVATRSNSDTRDAELRVYDRSGVQLASRSFANRDLDSPADVDVAPSGNYYIATQFGRGVAEYSSSGGYIASFTNDIPAHMSGVAALPGGVVWGGANPNLSTPEQNFIAIYDPVTRDQIGSVPLDHGQRSANHLAYSRATNTVLIADYVGNALVERDTSGNYIRTFTAPGFQRPIGVTRGPEGDVFSVIFSTNNLYRWNANGDFLGVTSLASSVNGPSRIIWAGESVPEPRSFGLAIIGLVTVLGSRRSATGIARKGRGTSARIIHPNVPRTQRGGEKTLHFARGQ